MASARAAAARTTRTSTCCATRSTPALRLRWRWSPRSSRTPVQGANRVAPSAEGRGMGRLFTIACLLPLPALPAVAQASDTVSRQVPGTPADKLAKLPIDPYAYDYAKKCLKHPQEGTLALQDWLEKQAGGVSWGIMR